MKRTEMADLRAMSTEDLQRRVEEKRRDLYKIREKRVVEQLNNPFEVSQIRRDIARMKTIIGEKERGGKGEKSRVSRERRKIAARRKEAKA